MALTRPAKAFAKGNQAVGTRLRNFREGKGELEITGWVYRQNRTGLAKPSEWVHERTLSPTRMEGVAADLFRLPDGKRVVVRSEPGVHEPGFNTEMTRMLVHAARNKVDIESPFGVMLGFDADGKRFAAHVSRFIEGKTLREALPGMGVEERYAAAVKVMKRMRRIHDAELVHGHLHLDNIILTPRNRPVIIDPTGLQGTVASRREFMKEADIGFFLTNALEYGLLDVSNAAKAVQAGYGSSAERASELIRTALQESGLASYRRQNPERQ